MNRNYGPFEFFSLVLTDLYQFRQNNAINKDVLIKQILFTGYEALPIISILSLMIGTVIIQEVYAFLVTLGQADLTYDILVSLIVRDLGPILTGFIILARSGTAISTELGNMSVNKEIDALRAMGISPISYIVSPRIVGMVLSMLILIVYFMIIGIFGGYFVSSFTIPLPFAEFFEKFIAALAPADVILMLLKTGISGLVVAGICSFHGLNVFRAITEVPQRNIKAVVQSVLALFIINVAGTVALLVV